MSGEAQDCEWRPFPLLRAPTLACHWKGKREAEVGRGRWLIVFFRQSSHRLSPIKMVAARPMTCFTRHIDLLIACLELLAAGIKVFGDTRRVTLSTHMIPVVQRAGPVKRVSGWSLLTRKEGIPALRFCTTSSGPGDGIALKFARFLFNQNLLARFDSKKVLHRFLDFP